mmetsp:Transcript_18010/g.29843  ORF Transcript_18010/g.29843 Transcript_18010/m.29843 type:complete len:241 (-) Transcript_18010:145-867(-)
MPPTLGQVKSAFPLPGRYHFRFKSPLVPGGDRESKHNISVWMDCVDDRQPIPTWKNSIVAKVTRTSVEEEDDDDDDDEDFRGRTAAPPAPTPQQQHRPAPPRAAPVPQQRPAEPMLDIFDSGHPQQAQPPAAPRSAPPSNLFDVPNPAAPPASLLDMGTAPAYQQHAANDFLGMTAPPATPSPNQQQQQQHQQGYGTPYPPQQQQQQQQQAPRSGNNNNAFNGYAQQQGPFGGLGTPWKG